MLSGSLQGGHGEDCSLVVKIYTGTLYEARCGGSGRPSRGNVLTAVILMQHQGINRRRGAAVAFSAVQIANFRTLGRM